MPRTELVGHHATWWRSKVKQEKKLIIPIPPFEPYDPFEWYWPQGGGTREEKSLQYRFLDVDAANPDAIHQFSQRFGVLGNMKNTGWSYKPSAVPTMEAAKLFLKKVIPGLDNRVTKKDSTAAIADFQGLAAFGVPPDHSRCEPMSLEDFRHAQDTLHRTIEIASVCQSPSASESLPPEFMESLQRLFSKTISWKLSNVRPRLYWNDQAAQWQTTWDIGSLEAAMYLMLFFDIQGRGHILTCPRCNGVFLGDHPRTEYCSPRCQNSAKVARHRANKSAGSVEGHKRLKENKLG